jgi:hypothetical protein
MERTFKMGAIILLTGAFIACVLAVVLLRDSFDAVPIIDRRGTIFKSRAPLSIPFDLVEGTISLPLPNIEGELSVSFDPPRPNIARSSSAAYSVRLKKTGQVRRVSLPDRIDFQYEKELQFADQRGLFWVDLQREDSNQIAAHVFMNDLPGSSGEVGSFYITPEESPIRAAQDFAEGSPFRILAEARLLGRDLFLGKYSEGEFVQRLGFSSPLKGEIIALKVGDLLAWKGGVWCKVEALIEGDGSPIARVVSFDERSLLFEAWGLDEYVRLSVSSSQLIPFKTKGDEFITSVRIRSEKQISCMMEKQCFVLRVGDWVLKEDNRWKVLRKAEEKEAYSMGKIGGELFVFDRIELRGGQKTLRGHLFNVGRSQMMPIDVVAYSPKKQGQSKEFSQDRKGKGK